MTPAPQRLPRPSGQSLGSGRARQEPDHVIAQSDATAVPGPDAAALTEARPLIGIVGQYTGSNLGDRAIHEALMANLRARIPAVEFVLINLDPIRTAAIHGTRALPVTGLILSDYSNPLKAAYGIAHNEPDAPSSGPRRYWHAFKTHPAARRAFRPIWLAGKSAAALIPNALRDLRHTRRMTVEIGRLSALIVAGGGQIDDRWGGAFSHPYSLWKLSVIARKVRVPYLVLSVGMDSLDAPLSRYFTRRMLEHSAYRSYRDEGTRERVAALPLLHPGPVVPDLAFSHPKVRTTPRVPGQPGPLRVGVSPIAYKHPMHWPVKDEAQYERYENSLVSFATKVLEDGHEIELFAIDVPDVAIMRQIHSRLAGQLSPAATRRLRMIPPDSVDVLLAHMDRLDIVVASRLHGIVLAHASNVPVVALAYERKVAQHMRRMGRDAYLLDINAFDTARLIATFATCAANAATSRSALAARVHEKQREAQRQYDEIMQYIGIPRASAPSR